jgi:hypothetical protein
MINNQDISYVLATHSSSSFVIVPHCAGKVPVSWLLLSQLHAEGNSNSWESAWQALFQSR